MSWLLLHVLYAQDVSTEEVEQSEHLEFAHETQAQIAAQREATSLLAMEALSFQSLLMDQLKLKDNPGAVWCCGLTAGPEPSVYLLPDAPDSLVVLPGEVPPTWTPPTPVSTQAPLAPVEE